MIEIKYNLKFNSKNYFLMMIIKYNYNNKKIIKMTK